MKKYSPIPFHFIPKAQRGGAWANTMYGKLAQPGQLTKLLATPLDQGYNQQKDNATLGLQYQQANRQQEQFSWQKEQALIKNAYNEKLYDQKIKQAEFDMAKEGIEIATAYQDKISGLDINPSDQDLITELSELYGTNNFDNLSTAQGINENFKAQSKFFGDKRIKEAQQRASGTKLVKGTLDDFGKQIDKVEGDISKMPYYETMTDEYAALVKELDQFGKTGEGDLQDIQERANKLKLELNDLGDKKVDVANRAAEADIDMTEAKIADMEFDNQLKQEKQDAWSKYKSGDYSLDQYNAETKRLAADAKLRNGTSAKAPTAEEIKHNDKLTWITSYQRDNPGTQYHEAETAFSRRDKEWAHKNDTDAGNESPYSNIPVKKNGITDVNAAILPKLGIPMKGVEDFNKGSNVENFDKVWLTNDLAEKFYSDGDIKSETRVEPGLYGDGSIVTNDPNVYSQIKGLGDPNKWTDQQWEDMVAHRNADGNIEIPFSDPSIGMRSDIKSIADPITGLSIAQTENIDPEFVQQMGNYLHSYKIAPENFEEVFLNKLGTDGAKWENFEKLDGPTQALAVMLGEIGGKGNAPTMQFTSFARSADHNLSKSNPSSAHIHDHNEDGTEKLGSAFDMQGFADNDTEMRTKLDSYVNNFLAKVQNTTGIQHQTEQQGDDMVKTVTLPSGDRIQFRIEPKGSNKYSHLHVELTAATNRNAVNGGIKAK
jgi:hypothetical protein